ncbi:MAG: hypothetical protein WCB53_11135 [Terriglobales bacterium]
MSTTLKQRPRWAGPAARVVALTFLSTLISFAVALFLSILGTVIYASIERASPDLVFAYRHIALPIAITAGSLALIVTVWVEVRNYRLGKVLAAIERAAMNH